MGSLLRAVAAIGVAALFTCVSRAVPVAGSTFQGAPSINTEALLHDTRNSRYRSPFGAVPAGRPVTLRLRIARGGASSVTLHMQALDQNGNPTTAFQQKLGRAGALDHKRYDLWQTVFTPRTIGFYTYSFRVAKGKAEAWYSATALQEGGKGQAYPGTSEPPFAFHLTAYDPNFAVPVWAKDMVVYQIFPDRFFNGDPSNDRKAMDPAFNGVHPVYHSKWDELPVSPDQRANRDIANDFFGGDLQGIIDKLPYLKSLGVNTLYLNPIFLSPTNHKYDTSDYFTVDPQFGSLQTLQELLKAAHADGMHVLLDGVFNHTGSDSIYFNQYGHFPEAGAYQSKQSPYYPWYTFTSWPDVFKFFGDAQWMPQLNESDPVKDFIFRKPDSVAQHWLGQGTGGWRLDAAQEKSHSWWQDFRRAVKAAFPDAILIGEATGGPANAAPYLLGNELDGVMNYRFREAILRFFAQGRGSSGGVGAPGTVTALNSSLMSVLEDYPLPALYSSMNLVDSHDTDRVLYDLLGNKQKLKEAAALQMTWLGAPTIYYGDEAGLTGAGDPDDRRTFPWVRQDTELEDYYRKLIALRSSNPALRDGSVVPLILDNKHRVFAFLRRNKAQSVAVIINDGGSARQVSVKIPGLPNGARVTEGLSGKTYTVSRGTVKATVGASSAAILIV